MESSWRPPEWRKRTHSDYDPPERRRYIEAGASAIIPYVEAEVKAQTLREVGEWLKEQIWWNREGDLQGILEQSDVDALQRGELPTEYVFVQPLSVTGQNDDDTTNVPIL